MWNEATCKSSGYCKMTVTKPKNNQKYNLKFLVVDEDFEPLLGLQASVRIGLLSVNEDMFERIAIVTPELTDKYSSVFDGKLGNIGGPHHLRSCRLGRFL